jgi:hypothetical protein
MSEVLRYYQTFTEHEMTLVLFGLVFVFAYQLVVFRWAERSTLITATYFVTTVTFVGGPFLVAVIGSPTRVFSIHDREVIWTLLSYMMTLIGIACSSMPQHSSTSTRVGRPSQLGGMAPLPTH